MKKQKNPARNWRRLLNKNELATALLRQRSSDAKRSRSSELHPGWPHQEIRVEINRSNSDDDTEKLQERLAKLSGGLAIIRVSAATEVELKEKKHRVEDALSATRAAAVLETVRRMQAEAKNKNIGYDVLRNDYLDMVAVGIIDAAKVTKGALQNAPSIAAMVLTTEALITDIPAEEPAAAMPPGGGMYKTDVRYAL